MISCTTATSATPCAACCKMAFPTAMGAILRACRSCSSASGSKAQEREQHDLGGPYNEIADELNEILNTERGALDDLAEQARSSGNERRREVTDEVVGERRAELGLLPEDLAGRVRGLSGYDFTSSEARERFEQLVERLRNQVVQSYLDQVAGAAWPWDPRSESASATPSTR